MVDAGCDVANRYGLLIDANPNLRAFDQRFGVELKNENADDDINLPIPATYIVGRNGLIVSAYVKPDWTHVWSPMM